MKTCCQNCFDHQVHMQEVYQGIIDYNTKLLKKEKDKKQIARLEALSRWATDRLKAPKLGPCTWKERIA